MIQDNDTIADRRNKIANGVLDALDRWSEHLQRPFVPEAAVPSQAVSIQHHDSSSGRGKRGGGGGKFGLVSGVVPKSFLRGVGFIFHRQMKREKFVICLSNGKDPLWFNAEVAPAAGRIVGFWEYGVAFKGRAQMEQ